MDDKTAILIRLSQEMKEQIEQAAERDNRSVNNYVVTVLQRELDTGQE